MKLFKLYVGSAHKYFKEFSSNMEGVVHYCLTRAGIEGYTVVEGRGVWNGESERCLVVDVVGAYTYEELHEVACNIVKATMESSILLIEVPLVSRNLLVERDTYDEYDDDLLPPSLKF